MKDDLLELDGFPVTKRALNLLNISDKHVNWKRLDQHFVNGYGDGRLNDILIMKEVICLALFTLCIGVITAHDSEFVAAVYEHAVVGAIDRKVVLSKHEALKIVMRNMDIYEIQIKRAKQHKTNIIVFPEYGLTGFGYNRDSFKPFLEDIPDPTMIRLTACSQPKINLSLPIIYRLSCLAKDHGMYIVANMGDIKVCDITDPHCPKDKRYQYNTNVVFDDKGTLVARYHKQHPFMNEMKHINRPLVPEYITFDTPFGKFGTIICFDLLFHDPAIPLVTKYNVDHIVFPTAWFDVLPLFAAIGFHGGWARGMHVNFLGANTHIPFLLNTGSGIYSPSGVRSYYRSMSSKGSLRIAALSKKTLKLQGNVSLKRKDKIKNASSGETFYSNLFGDLFQFQDLKTREGSLSVCYNGSNICCSLDYKMNAKRPDELFALGVFDGLHTLEGRYYLRICTLIKCKGLDRTSCGQQTFDSKTIFESFTLKSQLDSQFVFPQVMGDGVSLLPGEWYHDMPVTQLQTRKSLSKGLVTAALFGRLYKYDDM